MPNWSPSLSRPPPRASARRCQTFAATYQTSARQGPATERRRCPRWRSCSSRPTRPCSRATWQTRWSCARGRRPSPASSRTSTGQRWRTCRRARAAPTWRRACCASCPSRRAASTCPCAPPSPRRRPRAPGRRGWASAAPRPPTPPTACCSAQARPDTALRPARRTLPAPTPGGEASAVHWRRPRPHHRHHIATTSATAAARSSASASTSCQELRAAPFSPPPLTTTRRGPPPPPAETSTATILAPGPRRRGRRPLDPSRHALLKSHCTLRTNSGK